MIIGIDPSSNRIAGGGVSVRWPAEGAVVAQRAYLPGLGGDVTD